MGITVTFNRPPPPCSIMAERFPLVQSIDELVNQIENFLQNYDDSISDIPALCSSFLSQLEQITPADNVSKRDIRRLKSRIRVRLNQARADISVDKSEQGDDLTLHPQ